MWPVGRECLRAGANGKKDGLPAENAARLKMVTSMNGGRGRHSQFVNMDVALALPVNRCPH